MRKSKTVKKTKRDLIVDAGIRLFARFPFSEITVAAVAREASCGHSLVYHYFKNINELYDESVNFVTSFFIPFLKRVDHKEDISPLILFVGGISQIVELLKQDPMNGYYLSLILYKYPETPTSDRLNKLRNKYYKVLISLVSKGSESGVLIGLLSAEEILNNLHRSFQGIVSSLMFTDSGASELNASPLYLPFLKGVHNV